MTLPLKTRLYTAEEFMALALDPDKRYELVRGEVKIISHPGREHTRVSGRLLLALGIYAQPRNLGEALPPGGFKLTIPGATQDTVRSPDLTFLATGKLDGPPGAFVEIPDLAVEVYSVNDEPGELKAKLADYQQAGWQSIWVIYPPLSAPRYKAATVDIYHLQEESGLNPAQSLTQSDTLLGEGLLDGFKIGVAELFK